MSYPDPTPDRVDTLLRSLTFELGDWKLQGFRPQTSKPQFQIRHDGQYVASIEQNPRKIHTNPPVLTANADAFDKPGFAAFASISMHLVQDILDAIIRVDGAFTLFLDQPDDS